MAARLPGRTDNEIKNYWNTHIRKRLLRMGIDPVTHTPRIDLLDLSSILTAAAIQSHPLLSLSTLLNNQAAATLNPESLRLISTLLALKQEDHSNPNNNFLLQNQAQIQIQSQIQAQMDSLSQLLQPNANSSMPITNFVDSSNSSQENLNFLPSNFLSGDDDILVNQSNYIFCENGSNNPSASNLPVQISNNSGKNFGVDCIISTPKSSPTPLNSSSTYINNSSSNEDERDSYCSNFLQFEIPEGLDFSELM